MVARLLCDDSKNWIAVDQQVTSPDFQALSLAIQGLGVTHHWLRKMEYELIMNGLVAENNPELYQSYQQTWAAQLRQVEVQPFAKHQVAEANVLSFPLPILILGNDNCIGWRALDKNGKEHEFSRVYLAERFIKDILEK